jgi:hypothetical protein|tara:strand:- start:214743 stop:215138 length:396 start_codon:yes stop_codon:yes gene_type:complete
MFFTGIRSKFIESTGFRSAGFISHDDANDTSTMNWLEASFRPDVKVWQVKSGARVSRNDGSLSDTNYTITHNALTLEDAVKTLQKFEASQADVECFDVWADERNLNQAEGILSDQKYSLRHKILNIGLPKL